MKFSNRIMRFQEGGPMPAEDPAMQEGAPAGPEGAPEQGGAPAGPEQGGLEQQMQQMAGQLVEMLMQQIGDPQAVMAILQMAMEMVGQAAQGGPQGPAPAYQKRGGRLYRIR